MSLEATYIIIDSSEYMRNGDFPPNRFDSQIETVNLLANAKTSGHPESTVGLMTMSGKRPEVLVTLGNDPTSIQSCIANMEISGKSDLLSAISVAQLALKHRKNKNGGQRIVLFVGSPIEGDDVKSFERLGARLKKNNIAMDIVGFLGLGEDEKHNKDKLTALFNGVNKQDNSHLILLEPSSQIVADILLSGPLFGNAGDMAGIDPSMDEFQMALKMSLEEHQKNTSTPQKPSGESTAPPQQSMEDELDEETRKAIELSMQMDMEENQRNSSQPSSAPSTSGTPTTSNTTTSAPSKGETDMDDEEEALRLSLQLNEERQEENKEISEALKDVSVDELFGTLPGVTTDSEQIMNALKNIKGDEKKDNNMDTTEDKEKK